MTNRENRRLDEDRKCEICGAVLVHLGIVRRYLRPANSVYRCYSCDHVVVEEI